MRLRSDYVIFCQTHVQYAVVSYCKILHEVCRLRAFAPQCTHMLYLLFKILRFTQDDNLIIHSDNLIPVILNEVKNLLNNQ